jgi:RimJ/RimL family protein N-acetyltransferase
MRPVQLDDAPFIVRLRNLDYVKGKVGDSAADVPSQERWLQSYFKREGDYYFIIETLSEIPLGTLAIYNLNETRAEIGRIVIRPGVVAGVPACFLLLDLFYEKMGMTQVRATSVASNERAHSLLRRLGFSQVKVGAGSQVIGGQTVNTLHFVQNAEDWLHAREKLIPQAQRAGSGIREWEQAYLQNQCSQGPAIET